MRARRSDSDPPGKDRELSLCNRCQYSQTTGLPIPLRPTGIKMATQPEHHDARRSPLVSTTKSPARLKAALQSLFYSAIPKEKDRARERKFACCGPPQILDTKVSLPGRTFLRACSYALKSKPPFPHSPGAARK